MKCPFLKKISFKKVNQVNSEDVSTEQLRDSQIQPEGLGVTDQNFDFSSQTIQMINSSSNNKHKHSYFNWRLNTPESSNNHLEIKYPKQLEIKPMMHNQFAPCLEMEMEEEEIVSESNGLERRNIPQALESKQSMMTTKCEDIFYGEVTFQDESENCYQCSIKDRVVRFARDQKVKYYFQMGKVECTASSLKVNMVALTAICKNTSIVLNINFTTSKKAKAFIRAIDLNNLQITQQKELQQLVIDNKLNFSYSMDSLGFEVERMEIQRLFEVGDTFDIILFKNRTVMSKVQRLLTNSDYDHVAMLLKTSSGELYILESSSNMGVSVYSLKSLINLPRKKYYFRVGIRRYMGNRDSEKLVRLQSFMREAVGKKYKFDPMYLISSSIKKQDTYFCSQLVCEALQRSGIMRKDKPSYKYLPKHFGEEEFHGSILLGGYSEIIILE